MSRLLSTNTLYHASVELSFPHYPSLLGNLPNKKITLVLFFS